MATWAAIVASCSSFRAPLVKTRRLKPPKIFHWPRCRPWRPCSRQGRLCVRRRPGLRPFSLFFLFAPATRTIKNEAEGRFFLSVFETFCTSEAAFWLAWRSGGEILLPCGVQLGFHSLVGPVIVDLSQHLLSSPASDQKQKKDLQQKQGQRKKSGKNDLKTELRDTCEAEEEREYEEEQEHIPFP